MAKITIRSTYALDVDTMHQLEDLAEHWDISKSAALRRAISEAACRTQHPRMEAIAALDRLHEQLAKKQMDLAQWERDVQEERRIRANR